MFKQFELEAVEIVEMLMSSAGLLIFSLAFFVLLFCL